MPDYQRIKRLGSGNFGEVWLVHDRALDVRLAVKYVRPARIHDPTNFYQEPRALRDLRHTNIVLVEDAGKLQDGTLYIAMEYLSEGSVETKYAGQPLPLSLAKRYICDLCRALEYAHQKGYVHRDIKPGNILIGRGGEAKLSDFGLATRVPRGESASPYGYLTHVAPEVFGGEGTSPLTDIYALGVTAYRLVNGDALLHQPADLADLQDMILTGDYPDRKRYRPYVPRNLRMVINRTMNVEQEKRYQSAAEFRRALERCEIKCDWEEKQRKRLVIYKGKMAGGAVLRIRVRKTAPHRFTITTTKKVGAGQERRVNKDCACDLRGSEVEKYLHRILGRYTMSGK